MTNVLLWWEMLITGEAMHKWGQGAYRNSLYLPLNYAVSLNCSRKLKSIKKKKLPDYLVAQC